MTATPRFSNWEAPSSHWPSAYSLTAEPGRESPSMRAMGSRSSLTCLALALFSSSERTEAGAASVASAQSAGTSNFTKAVAPASMAVGLAATMASPVLA